MLLDVRTYTCRPGTIKKHLALYERMGKGPQRIGSSTAPFPESEGMYGTLSGPIDWVRTKIVARPSASKE